MDDRRSPSMYPSVEDFNIDGLAADSPTDTRAGHTGSHAPALAGSEIDTTTSGDASPHDGSIHSTSTSPTVVDAASQAAFQITPDAPDWFGQPFGAPPPYDADAVLSSFNPSPGWDLDLSPHPGQDQHQHLNQHYGQHQPGANFGYNPFAPSAPLRRSEYQGPPSPEDHLIRPEITPQVRNTLTPAQMEKLKTVAMPPHLQYQSPKSTHSPGSPSSSHSGGHSKGDGSSPEPTKRNGNRKRKPSIDDDDDDDDMDGQQPVKKTAHNMIEKRYRNNLNEKIDQLRDSVPALRVMAKSAKGEDTTQDREELHGLTPAHKLNKATVLSKATEYIRHLEKRNNRLLEENAQMNNRINAFERLYMASNFNPMPQMSPQMPPQMPPQAPPMGGAFPQDAVYMNTPLGTPRMGSQRMEPVNGVIGVPPDIRRILAQQDLNAGASYMGAPNLQPQRQFIQNPQAVRREQIQQRQQQQQQQAEGGGFIPGTFNKFMLGSLAGLMLVEALVENEQSNESTAGRGLSSGPLPLLGSFIRSTHLSIGGYQISAGAMIAKLRLLSLLAFFGYMLLSYVVDLSAFGKSEKPKAVSPVVRPAPSLASPIHVRRQAWLTAIQTVWVPRHNFFLEAAALTLKAMKYTMRNVVGPQLYLTLFGLSEEQETARVKAWTTALDAQLAGGDVEINKSRLTLTLIASGTLPHSPQRLMLQALHIRVLLWQLTGGVPAANMLAAKLARSRWNEARQLHRILNSLHSEQLPADEELPVHLSLLLEQDCDQVFGNDIIQRAHNLAWNKPTTHKISGRIDGMDAVVDDAAVRSPLDAVAAWYSSLVLHRVLNETLPKKGPDHASASVATDIALAIELAPIGSNAQVRGLIARALLVDEKRGHNIAAAIQALGPSLSPDRYPQYASGVPPLIDSPMNAIVPDPDAQMALRCAMATAQLQKFSAPPETAITLIDSILRDADVHDMSLLGCAAAFHLMVRLSRHPVGRETCARSLERLAGTLRVRIGGAAGLKTGLDGGVRQQMVERCLSVTKGIVGMESDAGYVSMEESCGGESCAEDRED